MKYMGGGWSGGVGFTVKLLHEEEHEGYHTSE